MNTIVNSKNPDALAALIDGKENTATASEIEDALIAAIDIKNSTKD
jgi:hypothetical protein